VGRRLGVDVDPDRLSEVTPFKRDRVAARVVPAIASGDATHISPVRMAVPEGARRLLSGQVSGSKKDGPSGYGREHNGHSDSYEKEPHDLTVPVGRAGTPSGVIPERSPRRACA
jgi:hypothetical protein